MPAEDRALPVARAARDLGLAYRLTGSPKYAEKARRIFNAYSELYPKLPIHDNVNKLDTKRGARVMSQTLSEVEKRHIERTLRAHAANRTRAARELGISRATLIKKIREFGLGERPSAGSLSGGENR